MPDQVTISKEPVTKSFTPTHEQESKTDELSILLTSQEESKTSYSTTESHQKTTLESGVKPPITDSPSVSTEKANILEGTTKDESSHTTNLTHKPTKVIPTKTKSDKHEEALTTGLTREESTEPIVKASTGTYGVKDVSNKGVGSTAVYASMRMTTKPVVQEKTTKTLLPPDRGESPEPPLFLEGTEAAEESTTESHLSAEGTETKDKITTESAQQGTETIDKVTPGSNLSPEGVKTVDKITTESSLSSVVVETIDKITTVSAEGVETIDKITTEGTTNIDKVTREGEKTIDKITTESAEGAETIDKVTTELAEGTETIDKITTGSNLSPEGVKTVDKITTKSHLSPEGREPEGGRMTTESTEPSKEVTSEEPTMSSDRTSKEYIPLPAELSTVHESISIKVYTSLYPTMETRKHTQKGRPDIEVPTTESEDDKLTKSSTKFIQPVLTTTPPTTTRLMRTNRTVSSTDFQPFNTRTKSPPYSTPSSSSSSSSSSSTFRDPGQAGSGQSHRGPFRSGDMMWGSWWIAVIVLGLMVIILSIILIIILIRNERKKRKRRFTSLNHPIL